MDTWTSGRTWDRRTLLQASALAAASGVLTSTGLAKPSLARTPGAAPAKLKILILGGTGFLGPKVVDAAKARGHSLTLFNRGKTEKRIGVIDDVEKLYGNRDPEKHAEEGDTSTPKGLEALKDKSWDAVVDTSGYVPRIVKASASLLGPNIGQYVFISTISVYKNNHIPGETEDADTLRYIGNSEQVTNETYGPFKAMCEQAAEMALPGRVTTIRPGFIVGPGDPTDRFTYWPVRAARGGEIACPGAPTDPVQFIDVRDLSDFIIRCIEQKHIGVFNATGPEKAYTAGELLAACRQAAGKDATETWVPYEFLGSQGVGPGMLPILLPSDGPFAGFHTRSVAKAVAAGLTFRTALDTVKATLEWWPKEVARRDRVGKEMTETAKKEGKPEPKLGDPNLPRAGIPPETEQKVLEAWKASKTEAPKDQPPATK